MGRTPNVFGVTGALLIVAGAIAVATSPPQNFGWFAYAPLSNELFVSPALPLVLGGQQLAGLAAMIVGLVVASLALGLRLGRRRRQ